MKKFFYLLTVLFLFNLVFLFENKICSAEYVTTVEATAYNAYEGDGITATGDTARPYQTIAVDPSVIPLGSLVYVPGFGWLLANDTGGAVTGYIIDIAMDSDEACYNFGRQTLEVIIREP